jgi:rhodanese-related sulfurtransferase
MSNAQTELERYKAAECIGAEQIAKFDNLDFDVFTNRKWDRLKESHSKDIVVHCQSLRASGQASSAL